MRVAIVDYGSGNLCSAEKAFEKAGQEYEIAVDVVVTSNADIVVGADRVVAIVAVAVVTHPQK